MGIAQGCPMGRCIDVDHPISAIRRWSGISWVAGCPNRSCKGCGISCGIFERHRRRGSWRWAQLRAHRTNYSSPPLCRCLVRIVVHQTSRLLDQVIQVLCCTVLGMAHAQPACFGLLEQGLDTMAAGVVMSGSFRGFAANHVTPRASGGQTVGSEVGSEKLHLTWSPQSWLLSESWRLEGHWIDIHWCSDSYASLPWSKAIGL